MARACLPDSFCLARVCLEPPKKFVSGVGSLDFLFLAICFFFFNIPSPSHFSFFLLLFLIAYFVFLLPEACALWRSFVTGVQNNPRKSSERNRSKLCFGEVRRGDVNTRRWQRDSDFEYTSGQILSFSLEAFLYYDWGIMLILRVFCDFYTCRNANTKFRKCVYLLVDV